MRASPWIPLVILALASASAPAAAHGGHELILRADDGACGPDREVCFQLENVPVHVEPGDPVTVVLHNPGRMSGNHTLYVTTPDRADPAHRDTPSEAALGQLGPAPPGSTARVNLTVPEGERFYVWCDLSGHEARGMHETVRLGLPDEQPTASPRSSPLGLPTLAAAFVGALVLLRRPS